MLPRKVEHAGDGRGEVQGAVVVESHGHRRGAAHKRAVRRPPRDRNVSRRRGRREGARKHEAERSANFGGDVGVCKGLQPQCLVAVRRGLEQRHVAVRAVPVEHVKHRVTAARRVRAHEELRVAGPKGPRERHHGAHVRHKVDAVEGVALPVGQRRVEDNLVGAEHARTRRDDGKLRAEHVTRRSGHVHNPCDRVVVDARDGRARADARVGRQRRHKHRLREVRNCLSEAAHVLREAIARHRRIENGVWNAAVAITGTDGVRRRTARIRVDEIIHGAVDSQIHVHRRRERPPSRRTKRRSHGRVHGKGPKRRRDVEHPMYSALI
eukprot:Opistho-1_new@61973